jgi:hypothetical protein
LQEPFILWRASVMERKPDSRDFDYAPFGPGSWLRALQASWEKAPAGAGVRVGRQAAAFRTSYRPIILKLLLAQFALAWFMSYILNWEGTTITERQRQLLENLDASAAYWRYRHKPAECERKQPCKQANQSPSDTWIIFLGLLGTIGFLGLLAVTVLYSIR